MAFWVVLGFWVLGSRELGSGFGVFRTFAGPVSDAYQP